MLTPPKQISQLGFYTTFNEQLNARHSLYKLALAINWSTFEEAFSKHYSATHGAPAKPIRRMVALLILKYLRNLSDENVVEQWSENAYYQFFSGEMCFTACRPCVATELVAFRQRIGEAGVELILKESIRINGTDAKVDTVNIDTTVQEKNITYPTDDKLTKVIISKCLKLAKTEGVKLRRTYSKELKQLKIKQRFKRTKYGAANARKATKRVKTIAGTVLRDITRKLSKARLNVYDSTLKLFDKVLKQKRTDSNKIYSLHETGVKCYTKDKPHKRFEFGSKVSFITTQGTNVIVGALNFSGTEHDSKTVPKVLEQYERINEGKIKTAYVDRGYRGAKNTADTQICIPKPDPNISIVQRKGHSKRAAIEPIIGHLKQSYRLGRNFLKGEIGDAINVMLAAAAMNFKRMLNIWAKKLNTFLCLIITIRFFISKNHKMTF